MIPETARPPLPLSSCFPIRNRRLHPSTSSMQPRAAGAHPPPPQQSQCPPTPRRPRCSLLPTHPSIGRHLPSRKAETGSELAILMASPGKPASLMMATSCKTRPLWMRCLKMPKAQVIECRSRDSGSSEERAAATAGVSTGEPPGPKGRITQRSSST